MRMETDIRKADLFKIVETYFRQKSDINVSRDIELKGDSKKWKMDMLVITRNGERFGVVIKDWVRTLGVNQVRMVQRACLDTRLDGGILVSNSFSPSAVSYGKRYGISCFSRYEMLSKI